MNPQPCPRCSAGFSLLRLLSPGDRAEFAAHLPGCENCRDQLRVCDMALAGLEAEDRACPFIGLRILLVSMIETVFKFLPELKAKLEREAEAQQTAAALPRAAQPEPPPPACRCLRCAPPERNARHARVREVLAGFTGESTRRRWYTRTTQKAKKGNKRVA